MFERGPVSGAAGMDVDEVGVGGDDVDRPVDVVELVGTNPREAVSPDGEGNPVARRKKSGQPGFVQDHGTVPVGQRNPGKLFRETFDRNGLFEFRVQLPAVIKQPQGGNRQQRHGESDGGPCGGCRRAADTRAPGVDGMPDEHRDEREPEGRFGESEQAGQFKPVFAGRARKRKGMAHAKARRRQATNGRHEREKGKEEGASFHVREGRSAAGGGCAAPARSGGGG